ncbi:hypothetical protein [uncultured Gammaproteobacteria bacterium]|nr:hypothetical protein [uncultured Gammaproteobacteria bacterium]
MNNNKAQNTLKPPILLLLFFIFILVYYGIIVVFISLQAVKENITIINRLLFIPCIMQTNYFLTEGTEYDN